ncbi:MAG TPA: SMI1/KNR4 family protein [Gemmataceae bacterium]|nr:SMI1/KNR4 family protein [Gemmataceae bacterium]
MLTAEKLVERLLAACIAKQEQILPCTEDDLRDVARHAPGPLPVAYLDFLYAVGRGAGWFLQDVDIYYPKMLNLNEQARDILDNWEKGRLELPADGFVFSMRNGEQFMFFRANEQSDNPDVYHYFEGRGRFRQVGPFWSFLESELREAEGLS